MRSPSFVTALCCLIIATPSAWANEPYAQNDMEVQVDDLHAWLQDLADEPWCMGECFTIHTMSFSGSLASQRLQVLIEGQVHGGKKALVPLFSADPAVSFTLTGRQTLWKNGAYAFIAEPGSFRVSGTLRLTRKHVALRVEGPVGHLRSEIADAEVAGGSNQRDLKDANLQLLPKAKPTQDAPQSATTARMRLEIHRSFVFGRERRFQVSVQARGVKAGDSIVLPLLADEAIEVLDRSVAQIKTVAGGDREIHWIAPDSGPSLIYSGKWTGEALALKASSSTIRETWSVSCEDPYDCSFSGDAERIPGRQEKVWAPLKGQTLGVKWQELGGLRGVFVVAQTVKLKTEVSGSHLKQRLLVDWRSSMGTLQSLTLPEGAVISSLEQGGKAVPILKDDSGALRVNIPSGSSRTVLAWEIPTDVGALIKPPMPGISANVGSLQHDIKPAPTRAAILLGGLSGSPRIALWPDLGAVLILALALMFLCAKLGAPITERGLFVAVASGFAILSPAALIPLGLLLLLIAWFTKVRKERGGFTAFVEICVMAGVSMATIASVFAVLEVVLFGSQPLDVDSFVPGADSDLSWLVYLAGDAHADLANMRPWVLTIPVTVIRVLWTLWAMALGLFFYRQAPKVAKMAKDYWASIVPAKAPPSQGQNPQGAEK